MANFLADRFREGIKKFQATFSVTTERGVIPDMFLVIIIYRTDQKHKKTLE